MPNRLHKATEEGRPRAAPSPFVVAVICALATASAVYAQAPAPGSAVTALRTPTRTNTAAPGAGLLIPVSPAGQVESCAVESSASLGTLRTGVLFNFARSPEGCERRRDAWFMAATGDSEAAKARMCQERRNREAYAEAGHPCPQPVSQ